MSTTATTTRDRGDRYVPIEWAQSINQYSFIEGVTGRKPTRHRIMCIAINQELCA